MSAEGVRRIGSILDQLGSNAPPRSRSYWCPGAIVGRDDRGFALRQAAERASDGSCVNKTPVKRVPAGGGLVREIPQALCEPCARLEARHREAMKAGVL